VERAWGPHGVDHLVGDEFLVDEQVAHAGRD
jgi:hypothetical protein